MWALQRVSTGKTTSSGDPSAHRTEELVAKARALRDKLPNQTEEQFFRDVLERIEWPEDIPVKSVGLAMKEVVETLFIVGNVTDEIEMPNVKDGIEGGRARDKLRTRMEQLTPANIELVKETVAKAMSAFCHYLPKAALKSEDQSSLSFAVQLIDMLPSPGLQVSALSLPFWDDRLLEAKLFIALRYFLWRNMVLASGKKLDDKNPQLVNAANHKGNAREIVGSYLGGTYLIDLFRATIPFSIPHVARFEHHWLISPTGTGKSTTLSMMLLSDLDRVAKGEASVIVMESNRDLIKSIEGMARFAPGGDLAGRLVVIDVEDVDWPIAINLFDIGLEQINNASNRDKEALLNSAVSMLDYVFRALLGAELTSRQSTLFNFTIQLLIHVEGATLDTFIDLMQKNAIHKPEYKDALGLLDADARLFFELKFDSKELERTKGEVVDRLFAVKRIRSLSRMFSARKTKLDLYAEMGAGKVILINLASSLLGPDGVEILGRFFVAMVLFAAEKRQLLAKGDRLDTFFYIDEAHAILKRDEKIATILDECRKYRLAMIIAHQRLDQLQPPVLNALMGSTAIKFAAQVSDSNASALARNMGTTPDFILSQPKYSYAVSIRGHTTSAVSLAIPLVELGKTPRMSQAQADKVREDMRRRYAIDPKEEPSPPEVEDVEAEYVAPDKPTPRPKREKTAPRDVEVEVLRMEPPKPKALPKPKPPMSSEEW